MVPDVFTPSSGRSWARADAEDMCVWAVGCAFRGDRLLRGQALAGDLLDGLMDGGTPDALLRGLRGQYAVVVRQADRWLLASDLIRSHPLFYRSDGSAASDGAAALTRSGGLDPDSVVEFACAGFVTGRHTLYDDVRTVQGGEIVELGPDGPRGRNYYDLTTTYELDREDEGVLEELDRVVMSAMRRAAEFAGGRQVLIPLSGGLDSRLVASGFRRLGYDNVLCCSYGLKSNWESCAAREKAAALGLPWVELPFTPEQLRRDYQSEEMRRFWSFAGQAHSLPSIPDWAGIRAARQSGRVDDDAVVLSGQSGDFINGSHLRYLLHPKLNADPLDVVSAVWSKHYLAWGGLAKLPAVRRIVDGRIARVLEPFRTGTVEQAARAYEFWECRERQFKLVVQGGRAFEFFGHDWWMPLWDEALIDFFRPRSIGLKMGGYLYAKYLATHDPHGVFAENMPGERFDRERALAEMRRRQTPRRRIKKAIMELPGIVRLAERRKRRKEHSHYYRHNPLGFQRIYSREEYVHRDPDKRHVYSLWVRDYLRHEWDVDMGRLKTRLMEQDSGT